MNDGTSANKIEAIFAVREATETKVMAELSLAKLDTREQRDALLDASLALEAKTQDAIEACHACDGSHAPGTPHRH